MTDLTNTLWMAQRDAEAVGKVIGGLRVLCAEGRDLWFISEDGAPRWIASGSLGLTLEGITVDDAMMIPFADIKAYERDSGDPCVAFEVKGKEAMFAPAAANKDNGFIKDVADFLNNDWMEDDDVFLSDLDGSAGSRDRDRGAEIGVRRPENTTKTPVHPVTLDPGDELVVRGEAMRLGSVTWAQRDSDGDGNRFLHVVMDDGRYRRISLGDFGR